MRYPALSLFVTLLAPLLSAAPDGVIRAARYPGAAAVRIDLRRPPSARLRLPGPVEQHLPPLRREQIEAFHPKGMLEAAGLHRTLPPGAGGMWQEAGGVRVWRMAVRAAGAQAVRVHFVEFDAGRGHVWVHAGDGDPGATAGPYTGRGPYGDGEFWSDAVFGETAVVEYEPEDSAAGEPPFRIAEISHIFRGLEDKAGAANDAALSCHLDVSCYPEWADSAKAVARMVFETGQGSAYCSGALVMDRARSFTPYFLTADHCISNNSEARSLITYWLYQSAGCNQPPPSVRDVPRATGARYLAGASMEQGDFTLLQLDGVPDGVTFAGWSSNEVAVGKPLTGIHHPKGDYKRISLGERGDDRPNGFSRGNHYTVIWKSGHTEPGSSGSPVFSEPGVIAGVLSGGPKPPAGKTQCEVNPDSDYYGKFSAAWPGLRDYLDARSPVAGPGAGGTALNSGVGADFSFNVNGATLFSGNSGYRIEVPAGAAALQVQVTTEMANADVTLLARQGAPPTVSNGSLVADAMVTVTNGRAWLSLDNASNPPLRAGTWYFGLAVLTTGVAVNGRITATLQSGTPAPPAGTPVALTSGTGYTFTVTALGSPALLNGDRAFRIDVPAGAARLYVRVAAPTADIALLIRYGAEPALVNGNLVSDYASAAPGGDQAIAITSASNPPLKAGTYYMALAVFNTGRTFVGTITATISGAAPGGAVTLVSASPQPFSLPSVSGGTLFYGANGYRVVVPEGATRLEVTVATATPGADVDLYVRYGTDVELVNRQPVADYRSSSEGGNETVTITATSSPPLRAGTYYIALGLFTTGTVVNGTITANVETARAPQGNEPALLIPGVARNVSLPAADGPTLYNGGYGFQITVPAGATRLNVRLAAGAAADVQLYVRQGQQPTVSPGGDVLAEWSTTGSGGNKTLSIDAGSNPPLKPGEYHIAFGVFTTRVPVSGTVAATLETASGLPPEVTGTLLASGTAREISIDPVSSPRLFAGDSGYRIVVPEGATRLEIRTSASPAGADIDLFARYGSAPTVSGGAIVADFKSTGPAGGEVITITPASSPALRAGTYYIGLALFTVNTGVKVTLTATVSTDSSTAPPTVLTSGIPRNFTAQAVSRAAMVAERFRINVPQGARRLTVHLATATRGVDIDLYVRAGQEPEVRDGKVVADFDSSGDAGDESITVTPSSTPALRAGTYYISMAIFTTGIAASGTVTATVEMDDNSAGGVLASGTPANFSFQPVANATLMTVSGAFRIVVPEGSSRLQVRAIAAAQGVDIDLYIRYGAPPVVENREVVADYRSVSLDRDETVIVTPASIPPLRAGTYYATILVRTTGVAISGTITATISAGAQAPSGPVLLASGTPAKFSLPAVDDPTLFTGDYGFRVEVPQGATRLQVRLFTETRNVDTDLYLRYGSDVDLAGGKIVADYESSGDTGNESITVTLDSSKPLQAGVYYIGMGLFTTGIAAEGTVVATVESAPSLPAPAGGAALESGSAARFGFPAVSQATLFTGENAFRIEAPEGSERLVVRAATETPGADVDLFVRYGAMPEVVDGRVAADYASTGDGGDEQVSISAPRPGVYYIALAVFTKDTPVTGTLTATLMAAQSAPITLEKGRIPAPAGLKLLDPPAGEQPLPVDRLPGGEPAPLKPETGLSRVLRRRCEGPAQCY